MRRSINAFAVPKSIRAGRVLMHNHVIHESDWGCGINGFRVWTDDKPPPGFIPCPCGYAGLKHYASRQHVAAFYEDPKGYKQRAEQAGRRLLRILPVR